MDEPTDPEPEKCVLPPELFLPIFEELKRTGAERTLSRLLVGCQQLRALGTPVLFRSLRPLVSGSQAFLDVRIERWKRVVALLERADATDGDSPLSSFVKELDLEEGNMFDSSPEAQALVYRMLKICKQVTTVRLRLTERGSVILWPVLERELAHLKDLFLSIGDPVAWAWPSARILPPSVNKLSIRMVPVYLQRSMPHFNLHSFWNMISSAKELEEWNLDGLPDRTLSDHPALVSKLVSFTCTSLPGASEEYGRLFSDSNFRPKTLEVWGLPSDIPGPWLALLHIPGINKFTLHGIRTRDLLMGIPKVDTLELVDPDLDLSEADFEAVKDIVLKHAAKLQVTDSKSMWRSNQTEQAVRERLFWKELEIIRGAG